MGLTLCVFVIACSSEGAKYEDCKKGTVTSDIASEISANAICDGVRNRGGECQVCIQSVDASGRASAWFAYEAPSGCTCTDAPR
jgi:hypothetical protein